MGETLAVLMAYNVWWYGVVADLEARTYRIITELNKNTI